MIQVWTGKLSELQLPVQNPAERALAQVCHARTDALSRDEYQFHLLLHRNSHDSQADGRTEKPIYPATTSLFEGYNDGHFADAYTRHSASTRWVDGTPTTEVTPVTIW